ncbi:hypothetical protein [Palleronia abyssalis]|uniref:hypothetical protein n=1 Tax=Palleronia abyssalis TaxID=1501240 RepID=UPI0015E80330|nr:hypothetical protein [Palleronia abyssalis]
MDARLNTALGHTGQSDADLCPMAPPSAPLEMPRQVVEGQARLGFFDALSRIFMRNA